MIIFSHKGNPEILRWGGGGGGRVWLVYKEKAFEMSSFPPGARSLYLAFSSDLHLFVR